MLDGNLSLFEKLGSSRGGKAAASRVEGVITTAGAKNDARHEAAHTSAQERPAILRVPRSARRLTIGLRAVLGSRLPALSRVACVDRVRYHAKNLEHDRRADERRGAARIKRWRHFDDIAANQTEAL
jgi:hypothetical protein